MLYTRVHRVLIIDSNPWVLNALSQLIQFQTGFMVSQAFTHWKMLLASGIDPRLSIMLLDWEASGIDNTVLSMIRRGVASAKVIGMGIWWESRNAALTAGVDDFIDKTDMPEQVVAVLRRTAK